MTNGDIEKIAYELIAKKISNGDPVHMEWAVHELISGMGEIKGTGVEFYELCAREHVWRIVKRTVDKYDQESDRETDEQMNLEGFEYLQIAYTVEREQERILVPIGSLSDDELLHRAEEYDKQSSTLKAHAREIRAYVASRTRKIQAN